MLSKYRNNTLSPEEYREFLELMGSSEAELAVDRLSEEDWKESEGILLRSNIGRLHRKRRSLPAVRLLSGIAAAVALVVAIFWMQSGIRTPELISYRTDYGETRTIVLPDSSRVLLNSNSRLVWDAGWRKMKKREVTLEGEGYFEVEKVEGIEFVVQSSHLKVKVLGTVFNFRDRGKTAHVFLESGKVDLEIPGLREHPLTMTPGNAVSYDSEKKDLRVDAASTLHRSASWVEGMLAFENVPLGEILDHLEGLYGKKFRIEDSALVEKRMDVSLPYSNWDLIRKVLEISLDVKFTEGRDSIVVHN